jgi:hypothetical protein
MNNLLCPRLPVLLHRLPVPLPSLLHRASPSFFDPLLCFALTDFHVQLSYCSRTHAWESFFSYIDLVLNSKSCSMPLLRSASFNSD